MSIKSPMSCRRLNGVISLLAALGVPAIAEAQTAPAPPPPPANVIDLGEVGIGDTKTSLSIPIANGQNIWFRFHLTEGITPESWLNIDTPRSLTPAGDALNTEIGLYNEWSYLVSWDDFSGGGTALPTSNAAALTYGGGSGKRLGEDGTGWFGSRIDTGWNQKEGNWRPYISEGTYYVCVVGYSADFSQSPNPNWIVSTNFLGSGTVRLRVSTGQVAPTQWNEAYHGYDAGYSPSTAQVVTGSGPLTTILGSFAPGECDIFKFHICDPENFQAVATPTMTWGNLYGARMYLLDGNGRGILGINNTIANTDTMLSVPSNVHLTEGDYYLAISSNCGGTDGYQAVPYDAAGQALWDFGSSSSWNKSIAPNGTGKLSPMYRPGRQADCVNGSVRYFERISLSGACYIERSCPADFDQSGFVDTDDFTAFIEAFEAGC